MEVYRILLFHKTIFAKQYFEMRHPLNSKGEVNIWEGLEISSSICHLFIVWSLFKSLIIFKIWPRVMLPKLWHEISICVITLSTLKSRGLIEIYFLPIPWSDKWLRWAWRQRKFFSIIHNKYILVYNNVVKRFWKSTFKHFMLICTW